MATTTFYKRLRMEVDLAGIEPIPALPSQLVWVPWDDSILPTHASVKWRSFRGELDTRVFPKLATPDGCVDLMRTIRGLPGFLRGATWLIADTDRCCGTVQGIVHDSGFGMIQNLGVAPEFRGYGLGEALLLKSLHGFHLAGLKRAFLEVTARNRRAVRLYHRAGFVVRKTLYHEVPDNDANGYFPRNTLS